MIEENNYYIIKKDALPEVLLKVVEVKRLLESDESLTISDVTSKVGLSRSSFYKYKNSIVPFYETSTGKAITIALKIEDEPGLLSDVLLMIAGFNMNLMTIHQTLPINGLADITCTISVKKESGDIKQLINKLEKKDQVHKVKILARE